jgi:hypothetical protein
VLSGRGLCDGPIIRPEKSYRLYTGDRTDTTAVWTDSGQGSRTQLLLLVSAGTRNRSDCLAQTSVIISGRQSDQTPAAVYIGFESCCSGQNVFNRTCLRYAASLGPDLKPKLWDEIGEKLTLEVSTEIMTLLKLVTTFLYT